MDMKELLRSNDPTVIALASALAAPNIVRRLILIGATAGIDDPDEAADRRRADGDRATQLETDGGRPVILDGESLLPYVADTKTPGRRAFVYQDSFFPNGPGPYKRDARMLATELGNRFAHMPKPE